jgi:hypothetical protein
LQRVATIVLTNPDYGVASGVAQLNGITFDSTIDTALAATDNKPFMNPWVFTGANTATLANASAVLSLVTNTSFANGVSLYRITDFQDLTSNVSNAPVVANVIVSQVAQGGLENTLFLKDFTGLNQFDDQSPVETSPARASCSPAPCRATAARRMSWVPGRASRARCARIRMCVLQNGTQFVVHTVVNNTFLTAFTAFGANVAANTFGILPIGQVTSVTPQAQRYYGKVRTIRLTQNGTNYQAPPTVTADSVSARAQELFYLEPGVDLTPGTPDDTIVAAANRIRLFTSAHSCEHGRTRDKSRPCRLSTPASIIWTPITCRLSATHGSPRTGTNAELLAVTGGVFQSPGQFTTSRSFLSADKFLQDATFYNDYTYVIRVSESFDHYKDLLLQLIHPAGFKAIGQFVTELDQFITVPLGTLEVRRPGALPLDTVIAPYIPVQIQNFPTDFGGEL